MSVTCSSHACHVTSTSQCPDLQWTRDQHDAVWVLCPVGRCAWASRGTGPHIKPTTRGESEQCLGRREERRPSDCEGTLHHWVKDGTVDEGEYVHTKVPRVDTGCTALVVVCVCLFFAWGKWVLHCLQNAVRKMLSI